MILKKFFIIASLVSFALYFYFMFDCGIMPCDTPTSFDRLNPLIRSLWFFWPFVVGLFVLAYDLYNNYQKN